ncbi:BA75_03755T0 [Komagataella pastoris]|uniref:BA75_03755T0 n=1 Tax=Komagataella pastoris TaxID=4922 RepID=A0A1B2JFQ4_PICPA|nr:BA75_03755T0 [Komagataella pastoris]
MAPHPSSILFGVQEGYQLTAVSLKSNIATKYVLNNELISGLLHLTQESFNGDTNVDFTKINPSVATDPQHYEEWSKRLQIQVDALEKEQDLPDSTYQELESLDNDIDQLEKEYLTRYKLDSKLEEDKDKEPIRELVALNDQILTRFQTKYHKYVYEVTGDLNTVPHATVVTEKGEVQESTQPDEDEDEDVEDTTPQEYPSNTYYRIQKRLVF